MRMLLLIALMLTTAAAAAAPAAAQRSAEEVLSELRRLAEQGNADAQIALEIIDELQLGVADEEPAPQPRRGSQEPAFWTRGSHADDVLRIQGTPTGIDRFGNSEIWQYGLSSVTISTRSREVTEWFDIEGNLRVRLRPGR